MPYKIIQEKDFITTKWSGGETTQLMIYPENADFSKKNFLFRISSATFTSTASSFSDFSDYQRYILPLEGELSVSHDKLYSRKLKQYEVEYFDGAWQTSSENSLDCRDYNFIYRKGSQAGLQVLIKGDQQEIKPNTIVTMFSSAKSQLAINGEEINVEGFDLLYLDSEGEGITIEVKENSEPLIFTKFDN